MEPINSFQAIEVRPIQLPLSIRKGVTVEKGIEVDRTRFINVGDDRILVFVETKRSADFLASFLSQRSFPTTSISRFVFLTDDSFCCVKYVLFCYYNDSWVETAFVIF